MLEATQCGSESETLFSRLQICGLSSPWRTLTLLHSLGRPAKNTLWNTKTEYVTTYCVTVGLK
jgi:hypothetical protein